MAMAMTRASEGDDLRYAHQRPATAPVPVPGPVPPATDTSATSVINRGSRDGGAGQPKINPQIANRTEQKKAERLECNNGM